MDDTILVEDAASRRAWEETSRSYAARIRVCDAGELYRRIRKASEWYWSDPARRKAAIASFYQARVAYVKLALRGLGCENEALAREMVLAFTELKDRLIGFLPRAEETVKAISDSGVKLALLTNGDAAVQRERVQRFGLDTYFPVCLIEGEIGFGKPDPRMFQMALNRLNTPAQKTWMVGDLLETDIAGAKGLGIFTVWCDYQKAGLPHEPRVLPDEIINEISELLTLVEQAAQKSGLKGQSSRLKAEGKKAPPSKQSETENISITRSPDGIGTAPHRVRGKL